VNNWIKTVVHQKDILINALEQLSFVKMVYPSDANFLLLKVTNADELYTYLAANEIVVRNRSKEVLCDNCLRITIGTPQENEKLLTILKKYQS